MVPLIIILINIFCLSQQPHSLPFSIITSSPYCKRVIFIYASYIFTQWLSWWAILSLSSTISSFPPLPFQDQMPSPPMKPKTFLHILDSREPLFPLWYSYRILQYLSVKCQRYTQSFHAAWWIVFQVISLELKGHKKPKFTASHMFSWSTTNNSIEQKGKGSPLSISRLKLIKLWWNKKSWIWN